MAGRKVKSLTKLQIVANLYKDKLINERVLWNLLGARFRKHEIEIIDGGLRGKSRNIDIHSEPE
jgi:hypothetical protein